MERLFKFLLGAIKYFFRIFFELIYKSFLKVQAFFSGDLIKYKEQDCLYKQYKVDLKELWSKKRKEGISGFYRVKNEEELLEVSVKSHLPFLDEIVIVYNDCSDKTPEIAKNLAKRYPNKVKVYEYKPKVYPALSKEHAVLSRHSVSSLANYYNYSLSKTTCKIAVKIDADHIAVSDRFKEVSEKLRAKKNINTMYYFWGVNLFACKSGFCVNKKQAFTHGYDCGFFPVVKGVYFTQRLKSESLRLPLRMMLTRKSLGVLFYHLKGFKKDRGLSFMKKDSFFRKDKDKIVDALNKPDLAAFDKFTEERLANIKRITPDYLRKLK